MGRLWPARGMLGVVRGGVMQGYVRVSVNVSVSVGMCRVHGHGMWCDECGLWLVHGISHA